eukprot:gb/GEZN01018031.1/.p1 GENE.gb/GEZN01018031.1/~~gb/GEZN01018031.1/.p1  ORF type:complete len:130 (-),score=2.75 gb/GEZN01018031.1/:66-455(-)
MSMRHRSAEKKIQAPASWDLLYYSCSSWCREYLAWQMPGWLIRHYTRLQRAHSSPTLPAPLEGKGEGLLPLEASNTLLLSQIRRGLMNHDIPKKRPAPNWRHTLPTPFINVSKLSGLSAPIAVLRKAGL